MNRNRQGGEQSRWVILFFIATVWILVVSCAGAAAVPTSSETPQGSAMPPIATPAEAQTPMGPTPTEQAHAAAPRLLVYTRQGLVSMKTDGSEVLWLTDGPVLIPGPLPDAVSPDGACVAFLASPDNIAFMEKLALSVFCPPDSEPILSLRITSDETDPEPSSQPGSAQIEIHRAMTDFPSFAWSPDGARLAFIGAAEGPSADIYSLEPSSHTILQLTNGPSQAYRPVWSPDGRYIVHAAADGFGTGAGFNMTGIFAARADGGGAFELYPLPEGSGDELFVGWLGGDVAVTETWSVIWGYSILHAADLTGGGSQTVYEGEIISTAVAGDGSAVLFSADNYLYLAKTPGFQPVPVASGRFLDTEWSTGSNAFFALSTNGELYEVHVDGSTTSLPLQNLPRVSPDGESWVLVSANGPGADSVLWAGVRGAEPVQVFTGEVASWNGEVQVLWAEDGDSFCFADSAGNLFRSEKPAWIPVLVAPGLDFSGRDLSLAWMDF